MLAVSDNFSWEGQCLQICQNYSVATSMLARMSTEASAVVTVASAESWHWCGWCTSGVHNSNVMLNKHKIACCRMIRALQGTGVDIFHTVRCQHASVAPHSTALAARVTSKSASDQRVLSNLQVISN